MSARNPWNCKHQMAVWPGALAQSLCSLFDQEDLSFQSPAHKSQSLGRLLQLLLGPSARTGTAFWSRPNQTLEEAEAALFELYSNKAQIQEDQTIVEVGCGWGGWSLHIARRFPSCRVFALCSSDAAAQFIEYQATVRGLDNLTVQAGNLLELCRQLPANSVDRILSVETPGLGVDWTDLTAIWAAALLPTGKLFAHCFIKHQLSFLNQPPGDLSHGFGSHDSTTQGAGNHDSTIESDGQAAGLRFQNLSQQCVNSLTQQIESLYGVRGSLGDPKRVCPDLDIVQSWTLSGLQMQKTISAWQQHSLYHRESVLAVLKQLNPRASSQTWLRFQVCLLAWSSLFQKRCGDHWSLWHGLWCKLP